MRYMLAILALGLSVSALVPAAFAAEQDGRDLSVPVATAQVAPSGAGTTAGPMLPSQNQFDDTGHDRN